MVGQEAEGDGGCEVCGGLFGLVVLDEVAGFAGEGGPCR